jgi:hypothetical protein
MRLSHGPSTAKSIAQLEWKVKGLRLGRQSQAVPRARQRDRCPGCGSAMARCPPAGAAFGLKGKPVPGDARRDPEAQGLEPVQDTPEAA